MPKNLRPLFVVPILAAMSCAAPKGPSSAPAASPPPISKVESPTIDLKALKSTHVLAWSQAQREYGFRRMETLFPTRKIKMGQRSIELPRRDRMLDVTFDVEGQTWTLDDYVAKTSAAGLLVIIDGRVAYERYGLGHAADGRWTSFSVAKSLTSTLVGAAIKDGFISSIDDPVTRYLPALKGSGYDGVTVQQLLTMTSGVRWDEDYTDPKSDVSRFLAEPSSGGSDPTVTYMARLPRSTEPGTEWKYKTGESNLIGSLVSAATKKSLADYMSEKIWSRIGMETDGEWILNSGGREIAGCCISASLRDFGRFGVFFMNGAKVDGESILPDGWVDRATRVTPLVGGGSADYGYQWWTVRDGVYRASGIFGQGIWINEQLKLVVVTQSAWNKAVDQKAGAIRRRMISAIETAIAESGPQN